VSHETIKRYLSHTHANRRRDHKKKKKEAKNKKDLSSTGMDMSGHHLPSISRPVISTPNGAEDVDMESKYLEPVLKK